jgi:hypothetical protein
VRNPYLRATAMVRDEISGGERQRRIGISEEPLSAPNAQVLRLHVSRKTVLEHLTI